MVINDGVANITALYSDFTWPGPSQASNDGQAASGDSGGGVFQLTSSGWQLVGIMVAITQNQPPNAAVYGDLTFSVDAAAYRSQIIAILASTPPVLSIAPSGTNVRLCWADTGVAYNVEMATTISAPNWTTVTQTPVSTNGQLCVTVPRTNTATFFRLHKFDVSPPVAQF